MSVIGSENIGALNIAGSFAGAQRTESGTDRDKIESAAKKFQVDQKARTSQSNDVAETDLSADRDPDGQLPYDAHSRHEQSADARNGQNQTPGLVPDAFGERGTSLDLQG